MAVVEFHDLPLADRDREWDGDEANKRVREWAGAEDDPNDRYRQAFVWYDPDEKDKFKGYKLQIADIVDGSVVKPGETFSLNNHVGPRTRDKGFVEGGAITVYTPNGASVNVQMRWGMISENPDTWQIYYMRQSDPQQWETVPGGEFTFNPNGTLATMGGNAVAANDVIQLDLPNLTVNGTTVGNVMLDFGIGGITQFDNANGRASVTQLNQNGFAAGSFMSVAVSDAGRVVATYSNGEQIELFQIITANFNAENMLKRMDGGVYAATAQSGEAILSIDGGISGGALESSNTDISDEFTKLIVTQQAYAAGTRIVSTSDKMLQEALNMVR
jgi:flagellar hook protein FlgE